MLLTYLHASFFRRVSETIVLFAGFKRIMGMDGSLFGPVSRRQVLQMALGEVVGTGMLIFLGCMGTVVGMVHGGGGHPHLLVAFAFGLAVMICIQVCVLTYEPLIDQCTKECQ